MSKTQTAPLPRFALRLRELLAARGWSAYRLAKASGADARNIVLYLQGRKAPAWATVEKICDALGCSADEFRTPAP